MKKSYNPIDINQKHGNELSKKLYRTITDQAKRLDDARSCARNITDLFSPNLQIQRRKFCEYCERLIFSEPVLYGRKSEELLWRKGYYDVVATAKKLKKNQYSSEEIANLQSHINAGIGFYHHFISKLQVTFGLDLSNKIDFPIKYDVSKIDRLNNKDVSIDIIEQSVHQSLIYLGDLSRYKLEMYPNWEPVIAIRYYLQAIAYKPDSGMPHNQMGTLAMNQNCNLEAVYHYMRCLSCKHPFEGTTNNLISLFEKNSKYIERLPEENENSDCIIEPSKSDQIKRFLARFLLLIDIWYFNKTVSKLYNLCHQTFKDLDECLSYTKPSSESGDVLTDFESFDSDCTNCPAYLSSDVLFKISSICLLCLSKLQTTRSNQSSTVIAFALAIYSQLVRNVANIIQTSVQNYPLVETEIIFDNKKKRGKKKKNKIKLRRRKTLIQSESEDSDVSDDNSLTSSDDDSFISDKEDVLQSSEDEIDADIHENDSKSSVATSDTGCNKTNENSVSDGTSGVDAKSEPSLEDIKEMEEVVKKVKKMDVNDMLEIFSEQGTFRSIQILNDWLTQDDAILKSCGATTRSLFRQITYLLNLTNIDLTNTKLNRVNIDLSDVEKVEKSIPLSEDVVLKGVDILLSKQKDLDWNYSREHSLTVKEEAVIRIVKLKSFGKYLSTISETGISFDEIRNIYVCQNDEDGQNMKSPLAIMDELDVHDEDVDNTGLPVINGKTKEGSAAAAANSKGQLMKMKHMGQLWLASEVRALENRVRSKASLSPYLVLDADTLIKYTFMVKHLVHSRKFIVLVPSAVVSVLDDLKREKPEARDAIRWLETQFHRGNRFFRAQRPQERASLPFIKYPKKKDKEMFTYIQIIECCYYLAEQQKGEKNLVTLLMGNPVVFSNGENKEFSYVGLAQTAGVSIESITQFYGKWKKMAKENR